MKHHQQRFKQLCWTMFANVCQWFKWNCEVWPTDAWRHYPLIMVGVDTYIVVLQVKGVLAELDMLKFIFVEVRPAPQPCINDVRKTFSACHLGREHSIIIALVSCQRNLSIIYIYSIRDLLRAPYDTRWSGTRNAMQILVGKISSGFGLLTSSSRLFL